MLRVICLFCLLSMLPNQLLARDLTVSIAQLPGHSGYNDQGIPEGSFVDFIHALDEVYTQGQITIGIYPFKRSITNVIHNKADFHLPLIRMSVQSEQDLPFRYVQESLTQVAFVAYSLANNGPLPDLQSFQGLSVASLRGHAQFFPLLLRSWTALISV